MTQIAQHVDVLPTLLELVNVPMPTVHPVDGVSLAPLLRGEAVEWPARLLFEVSGRGGKDGNPIPKYPGTVRSDTHRWVHDNQVEMLFDLRDDPGEKNNIAARQPEIAARLSRAYDEWFHQAVATTDGKVQRFPINLDDETELLAPYAALQGGAEFFGKGWDNDWVLFPTDKAMASWNLDVHSTGHYQITVMHTANKPAGEIKAAVGESQVEASITAVYDPPEIPRPDLFPRWEVPDKAFAPLRLGIIEIRSGKRSLQLAATLGVEIQSVRLQRMHRPIPQGVSQ